jgi:predicted dehydrogenase
MKLERLLIVGLGSIGKRHARLARALMPGIEIAAWRHGGVRDTAGTGVDRCVTSVEEALQFAPQAAVIANPASMHIAAALPLAQAGAHLLMEKPLSHNTEGVADLIATCRQKNITLMTGYNLRFSASLQRFRQLLNENKVGRVLSVRAEIGQYLPSWRPDTDYRNSVSAQAALGGGVLTELSHEIDYLRWLFGEVQWVSAIQRRQSALEIDVEDVAHLVLGFAAQADAVPVVASLDMDFFRHDTTRCCTVIGEHGSLRWNAVSGTVELFEAGSTSWQVVFNHPAQRDETYLAEWRHFLECMEQRTQPMISGEDGLAVLNIIDAARRSSQSGAVARVEPGEKI